MQKDVIYIDTEDDITAIIGKVKDAKAKIVALVPPKRIGAIQSAVNLKLVHRAAEQADKRLVIISNNAALMALAGSAGIPVAKNLQSKPELAEIPALEVDEGEDIIDGEAPAESTDTAVEDVAAAEGAEKTTPSPSKVKTATSALGAAAVAAKSKAGKVKIPNFNAFRKKLFLIIVAAVLLIGGLVWALVFAPRATITITARTSDVALNTQVKLAENATTSLKDGVVKLVTKTSKKDVSVAFTATGSKNVGEKATGTVSFSNGNAGKVTISAGTKLTSTSGMVFTVDSDVNVPAGTVSCPTIFSCTGTPGKSSGSVTAAAGGANYNGATGAVSGAPDNVTANFSGSTSGGTDKTVAVVQQSDIDEIADKVISSSDTDTAKKALASQLGSDYVVLDSTFKADKGEVKPSPAVDAEAADGKGTLAGSVTFSIVAVAKSDLSTFLKAYFNQSIDGKTNQKVYDDGAKAVSFTNVNATDGGYTANITTNGKIGPKIDEDALKEFAKGKKSGEVQDYARNINGVEDVKVELAPFWVTGVPGDTKKISVEFKVNE